MLVLNVKVPKDINGIGVKTMVTQKVIQSVYHVGLNFIERCKVWWFRSSPKSR